MIKSAESFFMPPIFAAVDPLILFPTPPLIEPLTSDCSFKNVGEGSWPPDDVQMYIKKSGLVEFEILFNYARYVKYEIFYLLAVDVVALVVAYVAAEIMLAETERARRLRVPSGQNLERGFLPLPGHASDSKSDG